jgi:hypothetical protein
MKPRLCSRCHREPATEAHIIRGASGRPALFQRYCAGCHAKKHVGPYAPLNTDCRYTAKLPVVIRLKREPLEPVDEPESSSTAPCGLRRQHLG